MKRILIAGTGSGCGKTTVVCAVLKALCDRKMKVSSFKCGPDYIDPMFHRKIIGTSSYNLDSFFCDDDTLNFLLSENSAGTDISVIEGVMGYYDGTVSGGSAYSVAQATDTAAVIVIDCKGMSESVGAVMKGFLTYKENTHIAGFIFNRLPAKLADRMKEICKELGTEYLGFLPSNKSVIESRHLGLVTADEITDLKEKTEELGRLAEENILLDRIIEISERPEKSFSFTDIPPVCAEKKSVIAVAKDRAFCFIYDENINLLEKLGCEIKYFSPLEDSAVPECDGMIIPGGYPELYAEKLSENISMKESVKKIYFSGRPVIAECGGFMYLHDVLKNPDGEDYHFAGAIEGEVFRTPRLQRFGYITMEASEDCLLCDKGGKIKAHEFHYYDSTNCGDFFEAVKPDGRSWHCGICTENIYAGFPHIYFYSYVETAMRFVRKCEDFAYYKRNGFTKKAEDEN